MTTCIVCETALDGQGPRCCSASCASLVDLQVSRMARRQRRLAARAAASRMLRWRRWLPAERSRRSALDEELDDLQQRTARLLAAKLAPVGDDHLGSDDGTGSDPDSTGMQQ